MDERKLTYHLTEQDHLDVEELYRKCPRHKRRMLYKGLVSFVIVFLVAAAVTGFGNIGERSRQLTLEGIVASAIFALIFAILANVRYDSYFFSNTNSWFENSVYHTRKTRRRGGAKKEFNYAEFPVGGIELLFKGEGLLERSRDGAFAPQERMCAYGEIKYAVVSEDYISLYSGLRLTIPTKAWGNDAFESDEEKQAFWSALLGKREKGLPVYLFRGGVLVKKIVITLEEIGTLVAA